ncbi:sodium/glutamate symporter family protein [Haloplasma contractile]|uniref:Na+-glutamate symporter-like protein n=1 Tax=Haloplasma contractile SSD-17B TaxID=1033810 RepID=U2EFF6_9MOLU|nr:sodium/glutamate symporter [Haloplasma contractile]ERJ13668.1 Na+-glutamate symporter-like protein [Haloplasma contractile SSD-17B]
MHGDWQSVLMFCYIFFFMFIAKMCKEKLGIFKSIVIPTALFAGFIGMIFGPNLLGKVSFDLFGQSFKLGLNYDQGFYENVVIHTMAIGFIALALTDKKTNKSSKSIESGIFIVLTYLLQGLVGMLMIFLMVNTFWPDLFYGLGLMLPLSFGQGPGFSATIGKGWIEQTGISYIISYGLSLSTMGFLIGGLVGVILLNYYIKKHNLKPVKLRELKGVQEKNIEFKTLDEVNFFDNLTVQLTWIAMVYMSAFIVTYVLVNLIHNNLGDIGQTIGGIVSSLTYLFGVILALIFKRILKSLQHRGHRTKPLLSSYMMQNISSFAFNIMIAASVMAIRIDMISDFLPALLIVGIVGAIVTITFVVFLAKKIYPVNTIEYTLILFGMLTGTASTGMALLRGVDPNLEKDVEEDVAVLGSAIALPIALPIIIVLGFPVQAFKNPSYHYYNLIAFGVLAIYFIVLILFLLWFSKRKNQKEV